ncbi:MAG TPA: ABC transporter ATP-binding protein [Lachnospiraceae bacterium]|nr:ABC transporter ATP-binding protein [Lachnospiraceae bacterium]
MKKVLKEFCKENTFMLMSLFILAFLVVAVTLLPPQILRILIDTRLSVGNSDDLPLFAAGYLVILIMSGALEFLKGVVLTGLGQRLIRKIRSRMYHKATKLRECYYTEHGTGEMVAHFTSDVESVNALFTDGLISMFIDAMKIVGILISVWFFHAGLLLLLLLLVLLIAGITRIFQVNMKKAQKANLVELGGLSNSLSESIENLQIIRLFHKERYMEESYEQHLARNYDTKKKVNLLDSIYAPIIQLLRATAVTVIILLCARNNTVMGITAGMLAASIEFLGNLIIPIEALGMEFQKIQQGIVGIHRVSEFLDLAEEEKDDALKAESILAHLDGAEIRIDKVTFSYDGEHNVLHDLSLFIPAGDNVTLIGRTGAGKSTLMKLILGLYSPIKGMITLNGVPTDLIPPSQKRKLFGYVEQTFHFIPGTVEDQITLGDTNITREQVSKVCEACGLKEAILRLPDGYDTVITDGFEFSFGQRQLLSIARATVMNPRVLLLDEMTANLDSATEQAVLYTLKEACKNRTIISISHKLGELDAQTRIVQI